MRARARHSTLGQRRRAQRPQEQKWGETRLDSQHGASERLHRLLPRARCDSPNFVSTCSDKIPMTTWVTPFTSARISVRSTNCPRNARLAFASQTGIFSLSSAENTSSRSTPPHCTAASFATPDLIRSIFTSSKLVSTLTSTCAMSLFILSSRRSISNSNFTKKAFVQGNSGSQAGRSETRESGGNSESHSSRHTSAHLDRETVGGHGRTCP
jgi:hypothetical protein